MELRNLQTFHYASKFLNYSKTAQHLNFSQPAVTKQIQLLEEELNTRLFMRIGNKMFLTPAGEVLQNYTTDILKKLDEMMDEMQSLNTSGDSLKLAADISIVTTNLQPVIAQFYQQSSTIHTKVFTLNYFEIVKQLLNNEIDIGFVSGDVKNDQIIEYPISNDPIVVVYSPTLLKQVTVKEIGKKYPLIRYSKQSPYAKKIDEFLQKNHLKSKGTIEFSNLEAVKSAVVKGVGIAVLTQDIVAKELEEGTLHILNEQFEPMYIQTSMIYLKEKDNWPVIRSLQKLVDIYWG